MKTEAHVETMVKDFKTLGRDAQELARATAEGVGNKAREARTCLTSALDSAHEKLTGLKDNAKTRVRATDDLVRHHPWQTAAIAFGLGLAIGALVWTRNHGKVPQ
jgi:ElaB/YqjD/DUF883 family membrane-anchored ribosome-binding protein